MGVLGGVFFKNLILKKVSRRKWKHEQFPSMQIDKYRTFAKNVPFIIVRFFLMKKMHTILLILLLNFKDFTLN